MNVLETNLDDHLISNLILTHFHRKRFILIFLEIVVKYIHCTIKNKLL